MRSLTTVRTAKLMVSRSSHNCLESRSTVRLGSDGMRSEGTRSVMRLGSEETRSVARLGSEGMTSTARLGSEGTRSVVRYWGLKSVGR